MKTLGDFFQKELNGHSFSANLLQGELDGILLNREDRSMRIAARFPAFVEYREIKEAAQALEGPAFGLNRVLLEPHFPTEAFSEACVPSLVAALKEKDATINGTFNQAEAVYKEGKLSVHLAHGGYDLLAARHTDEKLQRLIQDWFDVTCSVEFAGRLTVKAGEAGLLEKAKTEQIRRQREADVRELEEYEEALKEQASRRQISVRDEGHLLPSIIPETAKPVVGSVSRGKIVPLREASLDMGNLVVWGEIFSLESKETRDKSRKIYSIDITDYTGSITLKVIQDAQDCQALDTLKAGMSLLVRGALEYDKYDRENVLRPRAIATVDQVKVVDDALEKRVELHLHTSMSDMDGMTAPADLIKQAHKWGQKAVAITDHGVAQAFPEAMNTAEAIRKEDPDFKVLYGTEAYFVNDLVPAVSGESGQSLEGDFICFDLETTGLSAQNDRITEIGAVRLHNGEITDRFDIFVDPERPIPEKITQLTSITNEMVQGAPKEAEALQQFFDFCGENAVLVAHNASFDASFVRAALQRQGKPFENTYIDTVTMARSLLPDLKKATLDSVANYLKLKPFHHHRAEDDAAVLGDIFLNFLERLKNDHHVERVNEINGALAGSDPKKLRPYHMILLVKNHTGLKNLYRLISEGHLHYFYRNPRTPKSLLNKYREGLLVGSACEAGELFRAVVKGESFDNLCKIASYYDYLEIQPLGNNMFMVRNGETDVEGLREYNRTIVKIGEKLGKPVVATCDVHFKDPKDADFRRVIMGGRGFDDADQQAPLYMRTTGEMLQEFAYLGKDKAFEVVVTNPNKIANQIDYIRPVPMGNFPPFIEGAEEQLVSITWERAKKKYGDPLPQIVKDRLDKELNSIVKHGFSVLYMTAQKLVADSEAHGYLVGSRGSVGSSLVASMSGISEVNPLEPHYVCPQCCHSEFFTDGSVDSGFDLPPKNCPHCGTPMDRDGHTIPFETFLGFDGDKVPDIDLNFSGEYQANAHRYTFELFGQTHVFRAGTIGTVAEKTAFGYVKKYMEERGMHITRAEENRLAQGCTGVKRTTGQHPGGMVVIPQNREIYDFCPVQHPADDPNSDIITTHFEYHSMESNLLKLDMLGHDDPTMIRMLEDLTGVNARQIPLDDPDTMSIFQSSKVLGYEDDKVLGPTGGTAIPEFGTSFVRGMLEDTQPDQFDILIRLSGFSHGTDVWLGNARDLIVDQGIPVGQAIGCRDDIMLFLISCGMPEKRAFKIMESVRKGRGLPEGAEDEMKAAGVPDWYIGSCKKIKYLFPKAHAVAYVMMAFRIAWFKVHRPLAFYAAFFSIRAKAFDATFMCQGMDVCKAKMREIESKEKPTPVEEDILVTLEVVYEFYLRGFTFEHMDLYRSHAVNFLPDNEKNSLLPPFTSVPGLGETAAWSIMEQRKGKQFISIEEFSAACPKVSKTHIEQLKAAGALDGMPDTSQITLFDGF